MAIDGYMYFQDYQGNYQGSESQVSAVKNTKDIMWDDYGFGAALKGSKDGPGLFEVEDFSFDIEQTLSIGSQAGGAGAGKVTFNPFSITRKIDKLSPSLFQMACAGTSFQTVAMGLRKSAGGDTSGAVFCVFRFSLVAVKTLSWAYDDEAPKETVTFEYGALQCYYAQQKPDGSFLGVKPSGWDRVHNVSAQDKSLVIK